MKLSVEADKIVTYNSGETLSDGSAGGIEPGSITFDVCKVGIDEWVTGTGHKICSVIRTSYFHSYK